jgi:hypothetical protein
LPRNRFVGTILCFLLVWAVVASPAEANDTRLGRSPAGVYPLQDTAVAMVDELIVVSIEQLQGEMYGADVRCRFRFVNRGPATTILMGFPAELEGYLDMNPDGDLSVHDFAAELDGQPLAVAMETGIDVEGIDLGWDVLRWATFDVPFGPGQERELVHTYSLVLTGDVTGQSEVGYVVTTGGLWAEPIGHVRVEFEMGQVKPWEVTSLFPAPVFRFEGEGGGSSQNTWVFEAYDLRPRYNPTIRFQTRDWSAWTLEPEDRLAIQELQAEFEEVTEHVGQTQWLKNQHASAVARACSPDGAYRDQLATLARHIASFLSPSAVAQSPPEVRLIEAEPGEYPGQWVLRAQVTDENSDLVFVAWRLFTAKSSGADTVFSLEKRMEWRWQSPWSREALRKTANLDPDEDYVFEVSAEDTAGNSVTQPLPFFTTVHVGTGADTGTGPGPGARRGLHPLLTAGAVAAAAGLLAGTWLWSHRRRGRGWPAGRDPS